MKENEKTLIKTKRIIRKKDWNKILMAVLLGLLALEIIFIPFLVYAEVKRLLPVVAFLIIPTVLAIIILFLVRACLREVKNK